MSNPPDKKVFTSIPSLKVTEEDTEVAVALAVKHLGPQGRMLHPLGKNMVANARLGTPEHGIIWYGDLDLINDDVVGLRTALGSNYTLDLM